MINQLAHGSTFCSVVVWNRDRSRRRKLTPIDARRSWAKQRTVRSACCDLIKGQSVRLSQRAHRKKGVGIQRAHCSLYRFLRGREIVVACPMVGHIWRKNKTDISPKIWPTVTTNADDDDKGSLLVANQRAISNTQYFDTLSIIVDDDFLPENNTFLVSFDQIDSAAAGREAHTMMGTVKYNDRSFSSRYGGSVRWYHEILSFVRASSRARHSRAALTPIHSGWERHFHAFNY